MTDVAPDPDDHDARGGTMYAGEHPDEPDVPVEDPPS